MATVATEVKINREAAKAIASVICKGLKEVGGTGSLLHSCVTVARQHWKGKPIPKDDIEATLNIIAEEQGWKDRTVDIRKSQYRSVLLNYVKLPEAMNAFKQKAGHCSWHDGIALAQLLKKNAPSAAVAKHAKRGKAKAVNPGAIPKDKAKAKAASACKYLLKMTKLPKDFRDGLRELCTAHSINVGKAA